MSELERPFLKEDYDHLPRETYAGLGYPTHRFADLIPVADDKDQFSLRESLLDVGRLLEPITLFEGAILDGRHRYKACQATGVEPTFVEFEGDEVAALQFVLAKNVARRSLTVAQKLGLREKLRPEVERLRAAAQERMATGTLSSVELRGQISDEVGKMIGMGGSTLRKVERLERLADEDSPQADFINEMLAKAKTGEIGVSTAYTNVSEELDRLARSDSDKVDPAKQRAALAAAISKAHALLVNADASVLRADYELRSQLEELDDWVLEALDRVRG